MKKRMLTPVLAGLILATTSLGLHAHGVKEHAPNQTVVKEQTGWGIAGDPERVSRSLEVVMTDDMRFTPPAVQVSEGETLRIVVRNAGQVMHELVIGDRESLEEHAELMLRFPNMEHDEPYMAHVPPGETAEIVWTFNRAGEFEFACLLPGHYQAGMFAKVTVDARRIATRTTTATPSMQ